MRNFFFCTTSGELLYTDCEHFPYIPFSKHLQSWRLKIHCASNIILRNKSFIEGLLLLISRTVNNYRVNDLSRRRFLFLSLRFYFESLKKFFLFLLLKQLLPDTWTLLQANDNLRKLTLKFFSEFRFITLEDRERIEFGI